MATTNNWHHIFINVANSIVTDVKGDLEIEHGGDNYYPTEFANDGGAIRSADTKKGGTIKIPVDQSSNLNTILSKFVASRDVVGATDTFFVSYRNTDTTDNFQSLECWVINKPSLKAGVKSMVREWELGYAGKEPFLGGDSNPFGIGFP